MNTARWLVWLVLGAALATAPCGRAGLAQPVVSPELHPDRTVTFRLRAPNAKNVTVWGEWSGTAVPMVLDDQGTWSVTLGPFEPDIYGYNFSVDGLRALDPANTAVKPMRSVSTSILDVPGDQPSVYDFQPVPHGTVHLHQYQSKSLGKLRSLRVYTPPGYDKSSHTKYPVLYLLHGSGDNEATWTELGRAHLIADNLLAEGKAHPMIIVMTDGHAAAPSPGTNANTDTTRTRNVEAFESDLLMDVIPFVESNYRVKSGPENHAIIGLSMGGGQSLGIGLNHPELFAWVGGMSSAIFNPETTFMHLLNDPAAANRQLKLLWFACGKIDFLLTNNKEFDDLLTKHNINHQFIQTEGAHAWPVWRRNLVEFLPLLFQRK